jgi:signal transduction histidine kinase
VTGTQARGRHRIALRIYFVTLAAVLAALAALLLLLVLGRERRHPPMDDLLRDVARFTATSVASRWGSDDDARDEVGRMSRDLRVDFALHRWDGSLVAATGVPLRPLSSDERDVLRVTGLSERSPDFPAPPEFAVRVGEREQPLGYLIVAARPPARGRPFLPNELILAGLILVGVAVAAVVLGRSIARPLGQVAEAASRLGAGDLGARSGIVRRDEVGTLARAFDDMADRMGALLRGQTELIANVAHELRTPLARIRVALDLAAEGDLATARESLAEIGEDLGELEALVSDILISARMDLAAGNAPGIAPPLHPSPLDVGALVEQAAERLRHRHPERVVVAEIEPGLPHVRADAVLLRRALDNLLDNARKYSGAPAEIRVRAARGAGDLRLEVIDRGEGIASEDLDRLFTPFFRADRSRARASGGVGLGLALSRRIVEAHGGTLVARSAPGEGTTMTIALPGIDARRVEE